MKVARIPLSELLKGCIYSMFNVGLFSFMMYYITDPIVLGTITEYITEHLQKKNPVVVSVWVAGQLYVVVDNPNIIVGFLPLSLYLAVKDYIHITEEEHEAVEHSQSKFPFPVWVRIKKTSTRVTWPKSSSSYQMVLSQF
jgi:hypothetical protein